MKTNRPRVLIEQWLPIDQIGAECMRERGASSALPPLYFLHVWWARRPLTVSRAAILASLLPAYPNGDESIRPWPKKLLKQFPTFESYKAWFLKLLGILGDPAASRRIIEWAKTKGIKLKPEIIAKLPKQWTEGLPTDMRVSIPYGYKRAFTVNPSEAQLATLYELLEWTWGTREITFCDPMAGGGSIPFEALRYGLTVHANELNPVASVILKATLDYPARFGPSLADDIRKYGKLWCEKVRERLEPFYPLAHPEENIFCYVWARTVACPTTGKPVPLSPNWWLRKGSDPIAVKLIADPNQDKCRFEIVAGEAACRAAKPDQGTVKRGTGVSPWTGEAIDGDYIKAEAQAGRMGQQLYAVGIKKQGSFSFRPPTAEDGAAYANAEQELAKRRPAWEAANILPQSDIPYGHRSHERDVIVQYGVTSWTDMFSSRQLLCQCWNVAALAELRAQLARELARDRAEAVGTFLSLAADKCLDYNSRMVRWHSSRSIIAGTFDRHDFSFKWSHAEFDAARNLMPWAVAQVSDAYEGIAKLSAPGQASLFGVTGLAPVARLQVIRGPAQAIALNDASLTAITVDPPYYNNVNYAELADFFYVWERQNLGALFPEFFDDLLTPKEEEATANPARFHGLNLAPSKRKKLAEADYENKMMACFKEMHRVLSEKGALTVMFTHKQVEAWDTLGMALIRAGFKIDASWPIHTESEHSLHQAKKNAAASTILLVCRKRGDAGEPVWWDDLKSRVRTVAREKAEAFEKQNIRGVDLYISTFGPVLSIISERWPVLTSESDPKTGDPLPLKPGEALDLAREEVINLRKRGLLLGRAVEFDPVTDWYLMAWDAFRAQEFPADEARKLALALGLDLERDLIREEKLVSKKSASVVLNEPGQRRKRGMVDPDAAGFPHVIDAVHTAMMIYDEEGSKACQVFVDRQGLRTDSRAKALVQAMMQAIPTTRGKDGKFLRPEMATLDALRLLFWDDLPAPKEEEPPKLDPQMKMAGFEEEEEDQDSKGENEE